MAEFSTVFPYRVRAVKLGYKPLTALFRTNLVRKRQIWPAAWCGLHYVSCRIPDDCIDSKRYPLFIARAVLKELIESLQSIQGVKPC